MRFKTLHLWWALLREFNLKTDWAVLKNKRHRLKIKVWISINFDDSEYFKSWKIRYLIRRMISIYLKSSMKPRLRAVDKWYSNIKSFVRTLLKIRNEWSISLLSIPNWWDQEGRNKMHLELELIEALQMGIDHMFFILYFLWPIFELIDRWHKHPQTILLLFQQAFLNETWTSLLRNRSRDNTWEILESSSIKFFQRNEKRSDKEWCF